MRSIVAVLSLGVCVLVVACSAGTEEPSQSAGSALAPRCDGARCPMPLCAQGQHLSYQGGCCPTCVGPMSRCAGIMCKMMACPEGQALVTNPGDCCGKCVPVAAVAECTTDLDCPQLECIRCPCPTSSCQGRKCVTTTPSESSCGGI